MNMTEIRKRLKGRTFLYLVGILLLGMILSALLAGGMSNWKDASREKGEHMMTSAQATDNEMFSYLIDTQAGRTLAYGNVDATENCITVQEGRGCFAELSEHRQDYVTRIETYQCGESTCTRTVQEWQSRGSETESVDSVKFLGVDMPYNYVAGKKNRVNVSDVREPSTRSMSNNERYYYEDRNRRYYYTAAPAEYTGTAWLNLTENIQPQGFHLNTDIPTVIENHTGEPIGITIVHWILQLLIIAAVVFVGYTIVIRDIWDGRDTGF